MNNLVPQGLQDKRVIKQRIIREVLEDILDREVLVNIDHFINDKDEPIPKRKYGEILIKRLVEDLSKDYLDEPIAIFGESK